MNRRVKPVHMRAFACVVCFLVLDSFCLPIPILAAEARLRTLTGEQMHGVIRWESNAVVVIEPRLGRIRQVPLSKIDRFVAEFPEDVSFSNDVSPVAPELMNGLPFPWESQVIGSPGDPGKVSWREGVFKIETKDAQLGMVKESGRMIFEPIRGDREISARVGPLRYSQDEALAGISFRSSADASTSGA